MKDILVAKLVKGYGDTFTKYPSKHKALFNNIVGLLYFPHIDCVEKAYETLEEEAYYDFVVRPPEVGECLVDYFEMVREVYAYVYGCSFDFPPPLASKEDIECLVSFSVTNDFHKELTELDFELPRVRNLSTFIKLGELVVGR